MKRVIVGFLAVVGAVAIFVVIAGFAVILLSWMSTPGVPGKTILEINLETDLVEDLPDDPVARVTMSQTPVVRDIVDALEKAADDSRVVGVVARVGAAPIPMAQIQEIRDAVISFRAKNKFAVAFAETIGEGNSGTGSYYLATAFDQIWLQPSGDVSITGVMFESPFLRGALDKLGITPRMDHRYEYKSAMNLFTEKQFTQAHREESEKMMNSWFGQIVRGIAQSRNMSEEKVRALVDQAPFLSKEAMDAKLIDGIAYRDEVYADLKKRAGDKAEFLYLSKYLERAGRPHQSGKTIALIYGVGAIARGKGGYDPVFGEVGMGSDAVAAAFRAAIDDKNVKAIIFRVDSPGGSAVASDTIWRETIRAKQAGKPVIVTMGNLAASGGYWVSMSADKIVAQPGTLTASIGVVGGKMLTSGFWDKVGLSWDEAHAGANATYWSSIKDYTPAEWAEFQASLDRIYSDFTTKVSEGRNLSKDHVLNIAKGRVWTGEDAKTLGLVDELGGFPVALKLAKQAASIPDGEDVNVQVYPARKSALAYFFAERPDNSERDAASDALARALQVIQPIARKVRMIGPGNNSGAVRMPDIETRH